MSVLPENWNELIAPLPGAHLLQTREWAGVKATGGWEALPQVWRSAEGQVEAAALVLRKPVHLSGFAAKLSILYIPRGPLLDWENIPLRSRVLTDLELLGRKSGGIFIKMDPEVLLGSGIPGQEDAVEFDTGTRVQTELQRRGWRFSQDQIQFRNTAVLDLSGEEADWLGRMKQKTRYNLRLAQRKGVRVRRGERRIINCCTECTLRQGYGMDLLSDLNGIITKYGTIFRPVGCVSL